MIFPHMFFSHQKQTSESGGTCAMLPCQVSFEKICSGKSGNDLNHPVAAVSRDNFLEQTLTYLTETPTDPLNVSKSSYIQL
jgi:hypothetical protein